MTKAERETRRQWLAGLKEGDEVAVVLQRNGKANDVVTPRLTKVSVVGWAIFCGVEGDRWTERYSPKNGISHSRTSMIVPVTEQIRQRVSVAKMRSRLRAGLTANDLTDDQCRRIIAIIDEVKS